MTETDETAANKSGGAFELFKRVTLSIAIARQPTPMQVLRAHSQRVCLRHYRAELYSRSVYALL